MIVGAFVSTAGGILNAIPRARALGVESVMIFTTSPRSFQRRVISDADAERFRTEFQAAGFHSLWIHGSYLMNFATDLREGLDRAEVVLRADLIDAARIGARGVIFHIGSHGGRGFAAVRDQLVGSFTRVLAATSVRSTSEVLPRLLRGEPVPWLVLENAAGRSIGGRIEELAELVSGLADDRVKICLDTAHTFAAGYPIHEPAGLDQFLNDVDRQIGLSRLVALHVNDSKVPFGSGRDRHENIGDGEIGAAGFKVMAAHEKLAELPWILEVPGLDGNGPDQPNVDRLRAIAGQK